MKKLLTLISMVVLVAITATAIKVEAFSGKFDGKKVQSAENVLRTPLKSNDFQKVKAFRMKAEAKMEGQVFTSKVFNYLQESLETIQENKEIFEKQMENNLRETLHPVLKGKSVNGKSFSNVQLSQVHKAQLDVVKSGKQTSRRAAGAEEVVNQYGVITAIPEGETKIYQRSGIGWYPNSGSVYYAEQDGTIEITELEDGTVYFKDFFSRVNVGAYIKGTREGNIITVPTGQIVHYWGDYDYGLRAGYVSYDSEAGWTVMENEAPYVLTVSGDTISLLDCNYDFEAGRGTVAALIYTDDDSFSGYGDSNTEFIYDPEYVAPELVEAPADLVTETWNAKIGGTVGTATVGFYGENEVYVKGICQNFPDSWIKGTIDGTTITFPIQFIGTYSSYNIFATGVNETMDNVADFVMTYDSAAKVMEGSYLFENAAEDKLYYLSYVTSIILQIDPFEEESAQTGADVDVLPYRNTLTIDDEFANFGVLDSNGDGYTWNFSADYGAYYSYTSNNNADDWLISPAIKLEAGKRYHFAIDVACASTSYPERFEVLIGTEAKASALTQSVLGATEVVTNEYVTYETETIEVAETGFYHFGIHAISDANMWRLQVKNFLIEAGADPAAPAAVTDFTVAQTVNKLEAIVSFKAPTTTIAGNELTGLTKIDVLRDGSVIKSFASGTTVWEASAQGYENAQDVAAIDFGGGFTATLDGGGNSNTPKYYSSGTALRMYGNNTMKITGSGITKIVFTLTGNADQTQLEANVGEYILEDKIGIWTGNANEIVFTVPSGKQARIQKIEIEDAASLIPGAEYSFADNAEDLTIGNHTYQVIPYNEFGIGAKSEENTIFLSISLDVPYTFDFSENLLEMFGIIDNNFDGKTWSWSASNGAYYPYSSSNDADDYLITLPFNLKAGKAYNVIVAAKNTGYVEKFEVFAGTAATVEGLTETVIPETIVESQEEFIDYEGVFTPAEDGLYYFAIHAISAADQFNLLVSRLTIEFAPLPTAPAAVADFNVAAGAEGALEANLTFTAPAAAINGGALTENVDVRIYRDGDEINTLTGVAPGAATTWKDETVEGGNHTYYLVAANESGDGLKSEKVSVFVGEDKVGLVENIQVTGTTANTVSLKWNEVAGLNDGYINTANVRYAAVSMHVETMWFWQVLVVDEVIGTVTGQTSGTFNYPVDEGEQDYRYFGVVALQGDDVAPEAGSEYAGGYTWALLGAPYALPFKESFTGGNLAYSTWAVDGCNYTHGFFVSVASDDDCALAMTTVEEPGLVRLESGRININGYADPTLLFDVMGAGVTTANVFASKDGGEWQVIATVPVTEEYATVTVPLKDVIGERFIRFAIGTDIVNPAIVVDQDESGNTVYEYQDLLFVDNIKVLKDSQGDQDEIVWTIAGSSAEIFGTVWDPTNTDNDMTEDKDGIFVLKKNNVTLEAGVDYEFKVVGNHSWDLNYGDEGMQNGPNVVFSVDKDGKYNLEFYFERNAGNKLYCVYNYASGGFDPGNLKMVYSIDYAGYNGFPFYVMGYVPEWINGVMTDFGAMYKYVLVSDETGETSDVIVTTQSGAQYYKINLAEPAWHQYFIADGIPTELDESYVVKAKVRASEDCAINVNMGWGWGEGLTAAATVYIGTKWQEVEWEYTGIGGTSCNLIAQPGTTTAQIEWASLAVYKKQKGDERPVEWVEYISNGSAESSWESMGLANVAFDDLENNYKICAWSKEKGVNEDDYGWHPFPTDIEIDPTNEKNHVFVVHGQPATTEGDASAWDNQFWIQSPKAWKAGTQLKIKFRYRCNYPSGVTTNTQIHKQSPGDYLIWHAIGDITFTEEWQEFDGIMTMGDDMAGGWSIAFNLNSQVKDAVDFYFDDLSWQAMKLDEGFFVAGCNTTTGLEYDFYNANEFTWDDNQGLYVATIGTRGKKETYVDQIMISTVRGDNQSFKANTIKPNGQINNDPEEWLDYTQQSNAKINLPGAGVWRIYIDSEYNAMAFEMIEGEYKPPIEINPNPTLVIAHALEREYTEAEAEAAGIEKPEYPGQPWDNQFYICANRPLSAGEETIVEFQYKATRPASASTQCHAEPGAYLHWSAIGGLYFEEDWQTFSTVFTVPLEADGMSTITFNLAEIKEANDYYFKDVVWKLSDNTESLINQEGTENFYWKAVGGSVTQCEAESEILNVPQALAIISTLDEGQYTNEYYKVKGIVTEIKEISTTYGNATFYIKSPDVSDETLYVYRAYGFNGEKITDENLFTVGDEVVLYSQLQNYRGIPETRQGGYLLSISHNVTPADVLAQLTEQIAATEAAIDSLTYGNIPGVTELLQLVAEAKTATEESGIEVLYGYINDLQAYTSYVVSLDEEYKWLEALMKRIELVIQNNPNANPDLVVEATNKIQEVRTAMTNGVYTSNTIWDAVNLMNSYYNELSKVYLTINVEEPGTLRAILEEMGFEPSSVIGLTISGSLDYNDFNVLNEMYNIEHLDMGETNITEFWSYMFSGRPLKSVVLPKNLQRLNNYTFAWCNNLTEIELPATLQYIEYNVFYSCYNLKSITYNSIIPVELYDQLMDWDYAQQCTLYVPAIVASLYESSSYWNWFKIEGTDVIPENIIVNRTIELDWPEGIGSAYKPNVTLTNSVNNNSQYGKLTINGTSTISMNSFNMLWDPYRCRWSDTYNDETGSWEWYRYSYSALVANAPMRADNVGITLNTSTYRWDFVTFPFDVKVGDIVNLTQTNAPLVIRRYDGKNRADSKMGETWINMTADMTLEAGKGYIWQSAEGDEYMSNNTYSVPALDNAKKNNIFANNDVTVELEENLSEFSWNRSWNLIGNPYPAFYDIRGMQTTAPITVWNGYNGVYEAYTPGDDNYILNPGQAFFIQRPLDQESITFLKEGRQIDLYRRDAADFEGGTRAAATQERFVFNLTLTGSEEAQGDRTRIVFNADAKTNYEAGRDASKFMSLQDAAVQLFTTSDGVNYAINERPAMDGIVELGMSIGVAGNYTFALNTTVENEVYLIDRETGNETRIDGGSTYTFYANKGNFEGRFALRFGNGEVTGIKAIASDSNNADNWYNLKGQRVNAPTKGLYIQNGKKTVVK